MVFGFLQQENGGPSTLTPYFQSLKYQDRLIGVEADKFFESNRIINLNLHQVCGELVLSEESD
ncbi:hypothetical protein [Pseudoalteromonas sp. PA2MD11]|uniref:hypothetical protein n=1 Tax=Pseudoalteromonas sp. PA2MD11 TaxID=2785057 RepID=UPI001ADFF9D6|nr:hypothetical protein [Pseudoalteromonas sp. PA2MD11]